MRNRINEKDTVELFEKFYISALANDTQLAEFFNLRSRELDDQIKEVTNKLKELTSKINTEQTDVYKLSDAFKDLGIEINNISISLKSIANSSRNTFLTKKEAELKNEYLKDDYELKIKKSEVRLTNALYKNLLKNLEDKIEREAQKGEEGQKLLKSHFFHLIEVIRKEIVDEELIQRGTFRALLEQTTEQYAEINSKVMFLNDVIDKMRGHEEEVLSEEKLKHYVGEMKKEVEQYSNSLYGKISRELDNITETSFSSIEEIQNQYAQIISILNGEINEIDRDGTVKAFKPLIRELIDVELGERGRFVQLLSQSIDKLSKEKDEEIQNTFKQIVTTIVGEGTKQNQRMARQNTEIGLRKMSEADIDDLLGRKLANIVDKRSNIGDAISGITDSLKKIKVLAVVNPQQQIAQKFFDGLSFSIYYYKFTIEKNIKITDETLLPENIKFSGFDYIGEFEKVVSEFEETIEQISSSKAEKYKRYKKAQIKQFTDSSSMQTLDVYCYFRYYDGQKAYFFLNQEPSTFFKKELDNILGLKLEIREAARSVEALVKNYSIPKVQVAIFNRESFDLPSEDDDCSVVSTKTGDKGIDFEEEKELSSVLEKLENFHAEENLKIGIWSRARIRVFGKQKVNEHDGKDQLWYFWSTKFWSVKAPEEKYLAVKMAKPFDDIESEEKFKRYVAENVWSHLQKAKDTGEMQDWVDSFTQKDSSVLNVENILVKLIKFFSKNWFPIVILLLLIIVASWGWFNQNKLQNERLPEIGRKIDEIQNGFLPEFSEITQRNQTELQQQIEEKSSYIQELEKQLDNSQEKLLLYLFNLLEVNAFKPFIFASGELEIKSLNEMDLYRLENIISIIQLIIQTGGSVKILIIPHINPETEDYAHNPTRASRIEKYIIERIGKNQLDRLILNVEKGEENFLSETAYGVSIKLLSVDN